MIVTVYQYKVILRDPLQKNQNRENNIYKADVPLAYKEGYLLKISDSFYSGFGEASPLKNYSIESLEEVKNELFHLSEILETFQIFDELIFLNGEFEKQLSRYKLKPSVRFALESAIVNLIANRNRSTFLQILTRNKKTIQDIIPINALLRSKLNVLEEDIKKLLFQNYKCFKLKINKSDEENQKKILLLNNLSDKEYTIRLDYNQQLSLQDAINFSNQFISSIKRRIEYIEEPFYSSNHLQTDFKQFNDKCEISFAIDETLMKIQNALYIENTMIPQLLQDNKNLKAFILKPSMLGLENSMMWARIANKNNRKAILTGAYETGVGMLQIIQLASLLPTEFFGFDTYRWIQNDILEKSLQINNATFSISNLNDKINSYAITKIYEN